MSTPLELMASAPNADLIRRLIDAAKGYERLCGVSPTCIHVGTEMLEALASKGFKAGAVVAGMRIIARATSLPVDEAICSRDERLFEHSVAPPQKVKRK